MSFGFGFSLPAVRFLVAGYNPFNQNGPTLDLSFIGTAPSVTNLSDPNGFTLDANFIVPQYQIAAEYVIWEDGMGLVSKTFSQIITFTRASTATFFDSTGTLQSAAIDAPRFDYDPSTLAAQGLLIEEARTSLVLQSGLPGAVAGSPGTAPTGWTTGSVTGAPTLALATSIYGSAEQALTFSAASGERLWHQQTINVTDGTTYIYTAYCEASSGNTGDVLAVINGTSTRTIISTTASDPTGGVGVRVSVVFSVVGTGTVILRMGIGVNSPTIAAGSVTMSRPQVEAGAFPTSYIPTTTTALTRSADVASVNTLSPWYNAVEGTLCAEARWFGLSTNDYYAAFNDGTASNIIGIGVASSGSWRFLVNNVGNIEASISFGVVTANTVFKHSGAYKVNDFAACVNGGSVGTDTSGVVPSGITTLSLNASHLTTNQFNGYLRRIVYYPRRLSNAELQTLTS
jgi:hypothetical protein